MEVHFNPGLQARLDKLAGATGRTIDELLEDVLSGFFDELAIVRETLDRRYDDLKSGGVKPIDADEAFARLKAKTNERRQ